MNILKLKNGKVEIRKENGSLIRTIGTGSATSADFNSDQSLVLITTLKGKVEIRKESGSLIRTIGNGNATFARFQGSDIAITLSNGKIELRKENGSLIRTLWFFLLNDSQNKVFKRFLFNIWIKHFIF